MSYRITEVPSLPRPTRQRPRPPAPRRFLAFLAFFLLLSGILTKVQPAAAEGRDVGAKPVLDWSVPDRYAKGWDAYAQGAGMPIVNDYVTAGIPIRVTPKPTAAYKEYADPTAWSIHLNGCSSTAPSGIVSYSFTLAEVNGTWKYPMPSDPQATSSCVLRRADLPHQGKYKASLTLHTKVGISTTVNRTVEIRDILIVSIGDSLASGEGNPDKACNDHRAMVPYYCTNPDSVEWQDKPCHRSKLSGPALAAAKIEGDGNGDSKYTTVTFISVACSGAKIEDLFDTRYAGQEPDGDKTKYRQLDEVAALVGKRPIDHLLISVGINQFDVAGIISECAWISGHICVDYLPTLPTPTSRDNATTVKNLPAGYDRLAQALPDRLPGGIINTYINDYPAKVFDGGACDSLAGYPYFAGGLDSEDGAQIANLLQLLNDQVRQAAGDHHWNFVGSLTGPFAAHAYCPRESSWFVSREDSFRDQFTEDGTAHPNAAGHQYYKDVLYAAIMQHMPAPPPGELSRPHALAGPKQRGASLFDWHRARLCCGSNVGHSPKLMAQPSQHPAQLPTLRTAREGPAWPRRVERKARCWTDARTTDKHPNCRNSRGRQPTSSTDSPADAPLTLGAAP